MASNIIPVSAFDLVIFGVTGDLARRKILPGLFHRFAVGQIPAGGRIIGSGRSVLDQGEFRASVRASLIEFSSTAAQDLDLLEQFLTRLDYVCIDAKGDNGWNELAGKLRKGTVRVFYLSVAPSLFGPIARRLSRSGVALDDSRIVVEKPFGHDLETAQKLNAELRECFAEEQIYRIDHYLGKEPVQNLMALRFANAIYEPLWNCQHIDHVQITVSESLGVKGRGGYYDKSGALRDMVQNHLMQLLCLTAMEPPSRFEPNAVRDEKLKVIRALDAVEPEDIVLGQYGAGNGDASYLEHAGNADSLTESFVALKLHISNWRWSGTPFYLRTGKKMTERMSEIAVIFRDPPHSIFPDGKKKRGNSLIIRLQPDEGITLWMTIKEPGPGGMRLTQVPLDVSFADALDAHSHAADAYERLIMDVIRGNQTLFMRGDEVEAAWEWLDPLVNDCSAQKVKPVTYEPGSSGPKQAEQLLARDGRKWRKLVL